MSISTKIQNGEKFSSLSSSSSSSLSSSAASSFHCFANIGTDNVVRSKDSPREIPSISLSEYLAKNIAAKDSDLIALLDANNNAITYEELHCRAQLVATSLLRLGIRQSDFVHFFADNSFDYVIALVAVIYLGLPFCPVPPSSGPFELTQQILGANGSVLMVGSNKLSTIETVLAKPQYCDVLQSSVRVIVELDATQPDQVDAPLLLLAKKLSTKQVVTFDQLDNSFNDQEFLLLQNIPHFPVKDLTEQTFLISFTSGTTGKPKGAIHTHHSILSTLVIFSSSKRNLTNFRISVWHPIGHVSGSLIILHNLCAGITSVLFDTSDLDHIMECIPRLRITVLVLSPDHIAQMAVNDYESRFDLSSVLSINYGGSKIANNLLEAVRNKYRKRMTDRYASTEFFACCSFRPEMFVRIPFEPGNCGTVMSNVEMKIVNLGNSSEALPAMEQGEICFRGPGCFQGYLNNEAATRETIDTEGWYHTGDVGYYDHRGCLFITDRIKELIKYKGYSITPAEIEDFLHHHSAVAAVCVVGVPHVTDVNWLRAYVLLKAKVDDTDTDTMDTHDIASIEQELIKYVQDNMGTQKRLRGGVRFIPGMPRTVIGKVDRQYFKRLVANELLTES